MTFPTKIARKQTGVYALGGRNVPVYIMSWLPSDKEVESKYLPSYIFTQNAAYYIDEKGVQTKLPIMPKEVNKLVSPPKNKRKLQPSVAVCQLKKMPENPVEFARTKLKGRSGKVYLFAENKLLLIDRVSGHSLNIELDEKQIEAVNKYFNRERKEHGPWNNIIFTDRKIHLEQLNDETRPLDASMDAKQLKNIWKKISACPHHENGEFGIYKSVLNPHGYPPNEGDSISSAFISPFRDSRSFMEKIKYAISRTIANKNWLIDKLKEILQKTLFNPGWLADRAVDVFEYFMKGQVPAIGLGKGAAQAALLQKTYDDIVIAPRVDNVYMLEAQIPIGELRREGQCGDIVAQRLVSLSWRFPHDLANVWIVSDMPLHEITDKKYLGLDKKHQTFVCFSREDARELLENIEKNRAHNSKLLSFEPFKITGYHLQTVSDQIISKELCENLLPVITPYQQALSVLAEDMKDYREKMIHIRNGGMNQGVGRILHRLAKASDTDYYPQFEQIFQLVNQVNEVMKLLQAAAQAQGKVDFAAIQIKLDNLSQALKDYISAHPYKSPEQSLPHLLLQNLIEFKKNIPQMVQAVGLPLVSSPSASSVAEILRKLSPGVLPAAVVPVEEKSAALPAQMQYELVVPTLSGPELPLDRNSGLRAA